MSKMPIVLLGGAAVVGLALVASRKSSDATASAAAPPVPSGKSVADMTEAQKKKLADWAKQKGIPVNQAWDLAKQVYGMKF